MKLVDHLVTPALPSSASDALTDSCELSLVEMQSLLCSLDLTIDNIKLFYGAATLVDHLATIRLKLKLVYIEALIFNARSVKVGL